MINQDRSQTSSVTRSIRYRWKNLFEILSSWHSVAEMHASNWSIRIKSDPEERWARLNARRVGSTFDCIPKALQFRDRKRNTIVNQSIEREAVWYGLPDAMERNRGVKRNKLELEQHHFTCPVGSNREQHHDMPAVTKSIWSHGERQMGVEIESCLLFPVEEIYVFLKIR